MRRDSCYCGSQDGNLWRGASKMRSDGRGMEQCSIRMSKPNSRSHLDVDGVVVFEDNVDVFA